MAREVVLFLLLCLFLMRALFNSWNLRASGANLTTCYYICFLQDDLFLTVICIHLYHLIYMHYLLP